jgi:hypothetical protein
VLLVAKESFDCFGGAFAPLGFPKNLLLGNMLISKSAHMTC